MNRVGVFEQSFLAPACLNMSQEDNAPTFTRREDTDIN